MAALSFRTCMLNQFFSTCESQDFELREAVDPHVSSSIPPNPATIHLNLDLPKRY